MIQKIVDNGLENPGALREITRALAGPWGTEKMEAGNRVALGRASLAAIYSGMKLPNDTPVATLALVVFKGGNTQILHLAPGEVRELEEEISMALMIGLNS